MSTPSFDIFLSCSGADRPAVRRLRAALCAAGLTVFLDESDIDPIQGITAAIEDALRGSTVLLAYYSESYTDRPACQLELSAAFLAGQREGDPAGRIIVANPEPGFDHILPARLSDPKVISVAAGDLARTATLIRKRVGELRGTIGDLSFAVRPRWFASQPPGVVGYVGRYRDLWALHSALDAVDRPLTSEPTAGPVVSVIGMPGIGKSALVAAYAWMFGAAYPGGVYVTGLSGLDGGDPELVLARYTDGVAAHAETLGMSTAGMRRERLLGALADRLRAEPGPSLWVVDDVPDDLDPVLLGRLLLPGTGNQVRTVLVSHTERFRTVATVVEVGPMTVRDSRELLSRYRAPGAESDAFERVADRVGGHPIALSLIGNQVRDRQGTTSYADLLSRLDTGGLVGATSLLADAVTALPAAARNVVQLAVVCGPTPLPASFVAAALAGSGSGPDPAGDGLTHLRGLALATRTDEQWLIHSLVLDAARQYLPPAPADVVGAAADALNRLTGDSALTPAELVSLYAVAEALSTRTDLSGRAVDRLLHRIARHYEERGEPVLAARYRTRLADRHPDSVDDQVAAAAALLAAGEYEAAIDRAGETAASTPAGYRAGRVRAEALDALARFGEADPIWARLTRLPPPVAPIEHLAMRAAHLRGRRLRGQLMEVRELAGELLAAATSDAEAGEVLQAVQLELARAEVLTDRQPAARERAATVLAYYRERGLPDHVRALEAQEVLAEADLTMHLTELRPDRSAWDRAEADLRKLYEDNLRRYGPDSTQTLATATQYAYALVSQGHVDQARELLTTLRPALARNFGDNHPYYLRATFAEGMTYGQRMDFRAARTRYERALRGQLAVLGPMHAHTLRTQYELAVAMKFTDDAERSAALIADVRRKAPHAVGRANDLYTQAWVADVLLRLPTPLVWLITKWGRPKG
jgi:TIR domain